MINGKINEALILLNKCYHKYNEDIIELLSDALNELNGLEEKKEFDPYGMFLVGFDIKPGLYKIYPIRKSGGYAPKFEIRRDARFDDNSKITEEYVNGQRYVELKKGEYIKLNKCKLVYCEDLVLSE